MKANTLEEKQVRQVRNKFNIIKQLIKARMNPCGGQEGSGERKEK